MIKTCVACQKEYTTEDKRQKYCSLTCVYANRRSNKIIVQCQNCGAGKEIFPCRNDGRMHFCSTACHDEYQKTLTGTKGANWKGKRLARVCNFCHKTFKPTRSKNRKDFQQYCSDRCRLEMLFEVQIGEEHPAWNGGTTPFRRLIENSKEYKRWRQSVFKRDKYRCSMCGSNRNICAHHIKTFSDYPELRTDVSNGVTLCDNCHLLTYSKEPLYEDYFYNILSFLKEFNFLEVRVSYAI